MDQEKTRRIVKATRKRFRSNQEDLNENKRHKDLLDGDLEDFMYLLDNYENKLDVSMSQPKMDDLTTEATPIPNSELLNEFRIMLSSLEGRLGNKIDELKSNLKPRTRK